VDCGLYFEFYILQKAIMGWEDGDKERGGEVRVYGVSKFGFNTNHKNSIGILLEKKGEKV
jgi:hypothetical protein